jgi:hypothetical protein
MTFSSNEEPWLNYEAAMALVREFKNPALEQFVMRAVTAATLRCANGEPPAAPFDMLFLVKTMAALFEQRKNLVRVLSGEDLRWWPEDE